MNLTASMCKGIVGVCLTIAVFGTQAAADKQAAAGKDVELYKVNKVVFLIHAGIYENIEKEAPERLRTMNWQLYRDWEKICQERWQEGVDRLSAEPGTVFAHLYGSGSIFDYAREKFGDRRFISASAKFNKDRPISEYQDALADSIREAIVANRLDMDLDTVEWELWGETFAGCAQSYGTGIATSLGVTKPAVAQFDMCLPGARFLCGAKLVETFTVDGTDIRCWVFESSEGYPITTFMRGIRPEPGAPDRYVSIELDVGAIRIDNKIGITLFSRKGGRGNPGPERDYEGIEVREDGKGLLVLPEQGRYLRTPTLSMEDVLTAMKAVKVVVRN